MLLLNPASTFIEHDLPLNNHNSHIVVLEVFIKMRALYFCTFFTTPIFRTGMHDNPPRTEIRLFDPRYDVILLGLVGRKSVLGYIGWI